MTLTLEPPTTLPGMPVGFCVTVTNRSDQPVTIPAALMLRVTPAW